MRSSLRPALLMSAVVLALNGRAHGAGYDVLETRDLRLIYRDLVHESLAPHTARCFENAMSFYRTVFEYVPDEKVTVLLDDAYDYNNGAAFAAPRNTILVQIAPANTVYETLPSNERINHTMNHELAHIVALDGTARGDRLFRQLFLGKVATTAEQPETILYEYLTHPRFAAPRWYHEGLASFLETWMAGGIGRAQGAYDEMVFRAMVRDGARFYDPLGLESEGTKVEFQVGAMSYLYGTRFMTYLGYTYSPEAVIRWAARTDGSAAYYAHEFEQIFGMSLERAWRNWIEWERDFQQANLRSVRRYPRTPTTDLSTATLGSVSRAYRSTDGRTLYVGLSTPGVIGRLAAIDLDDGAVRTICDVRGAALYFVTSLARDPDNDKLFFTGDNAYWRDLWVVDPHKGKPKRLMRDARIGDIVFDRTRGCLWGLRHFNGLSTLVRIPPPFQDWWQIHSWPYGQDVYDLDISPDGTVFSFSMSEIDGRHSLHLARVEALEQGDATTRELYDFETSQPGNFVFSPDGRQLVGSSYFTGVSNIWRYDLRADSMQVVSNCETGLFRPLPVSDDSLIVFRYSGHGFVPATMHAEPLEDVGAITFLGQRVEEKYPVVRGWNVGSPARVPLDSLTLANGGYRATREIRLQSMVPVVQGYKSSTAVGMRFDFSDPGYWNTAHVTVSVAPSRRLQHDEHVHVGFEFKHLSWDFFARYNHADFYDLVGPTKRSRKGGAFGLGWEHRLIDDRPRKLDLELQTAGFVGLETLPGAQNIAASSRELWSSSAELRYENKLRSLGAVDEEKGWAWRTGLQLNSARSEVFTGLWGGLDFGHPAFLPHSSVWLRNHAGWSPGPRREPFANFFFGGFGNNYVDRLAEKRYRDMESFPGLELNEIGATNFVKSMLEWNLPPWHFSRLGKPSFFISWLRPAVFATGIVTNLESANDRRSAANVGAQIDLRWTLMSRLSMTFSVGYAVAFRDDRGRQDETMISLKVL